MHEPPSERMCTCYAPLAPDTCIDRRLQKLHLSAMTGRLSGFQNGRFDVREGLAFCVRF